jgi:hypothetical protein
MEATHTSSRMRSRRRVDRAIAARRHLSSVGPAPAAAVRGRAWINGREVGGPDARFAHLAHSHD